MESSDDKVKQSEFPSGTHLDAPIRPVAEWVVTNWDDQSLLKIHEFRMNRDEIIALWGKKPRGCGFDTGAILPVIFNYIMNNPINWVPEASLSSAIVAGQELLALNLHSVSSLSGEDVEYLFPEAIPGYISNLWSFTELLETFARHTSKPEVDRVYKKLSRGNCRLDLRPDMGSLKLTGFLKIVGKQHMFCITIVIAGVETQFACHKNYLLMLLDSLSQRLLTLISGWIAEANRIHVYPTPKETLKVYEWGDRILTEMRNTGYPVLAKWEALCIGTFLDDPDETKMVGSEFKTYIQAEITGLLTPGINPVPYVRDISTFLTSLKEDSPHKLAQVFGYYRMWGHPIVDVAGGVRKLKEVATKVKTYTKDQVKEINEISNLFKETVCLGYYNDKGIYPELDLSGVRDGYLKACLSRNIGVVVQHPGYHRSDWGLVMGKLTFALADSFSVMDFLADKAGSLTTQELYKYIKPINKFQSIGPAHLRSVLYQWLKKELGTPFELLSSIDKNGFPEGERICGVVDKEREMKIFPRFFGLLTIVKRMYVVVTEELISRDFLPFFPEITMKDSLKELLSKTYQNTKGALSSVNSHLVFSSLDFEKWNSNMREEETKQIFQFMDQLYGFTNVISRTHEMFSQCSFYLANQTYIPKVKDPENLGQDRPLKPDTMCWEGHLGGIEGLRQKGWTIFTTCLLKRVKEITGHQFRLMGQGDNQIMCIEFPKTLSDREVRVEVDQFKTKMSDYLKLIGPPCKQEETWMSSVMFSYGKHLVFKGASLCMSQKKLARMFKDSNEGLPTNESLMSSLSANLMSAAHSELSPTVPFMVYLLMTFASLKLNMTRSPIHSWDSLPYLARIHKPDPVSHQLTVKIPNGRGSLIDYKFTIPRQFSSGSDLEIQALMLCPQALGGYPVTLLGSCFCRGFPDPLTENIALLSKMVKKARGPLKEILQNILDPLLNPYVTPAMLFQDPVSINLLRESSPSSRFKRYASDFLGKSGVVENPELLPFITLASERQDELAEVLYTMEPLNPRIGSEVMKATLQGRAIAIMSRLTKTNTVVRMAKSWETQTNIIKLVKETDKRFHSEILLQVYKKGTDTELSGEWEESSQVSVRQGRGLPACSRERSDLLRKRSWKKEVFGVTTTSSWEAFQRQKIGEDWCSYCKDGNLDYALLKLVLTLDPSHYRGEKLGPLSPYLGGGTREKGISYWKEYIDERCPLVEKAAGLLRLVNWGITKGSNFHALLELVLGSVSDIDPRLFIPKDRVSGSVEHRLLDETTKHGGFPTPLYNFFTLMHMSTGTLSTYNKGGGNYTLHFQHLLSAILATESMRLTLSPAGLKRGTLFHYHQTCRTCVRKINEDSIEVDRLPETGLTPEKGSRWTYVSKDQLKWKTKFCGEEIKERVLATLGYTEIIWYCSLFAYKVVSLLSREAGELGEGVASKMEFPVTWSFKLNIIHLTECLAWMHISTCLQRGNSDHMSPGEVLDQGRKVEARAFGRLAFMLVPLSQRAEVAQSEFEVSTPSDSPVTTSQISRCLRNLFLEVLKGILTSKPDFSYPWVTTSRNMLSLHPVLIKQTSLWMKDQDNFSIKELKKLKITLLNDYREGANIRQDSLALGGIDPAFCTRIEIDLHSVVSRLDSVPLGISQVPESLKSGFPPSLSFSVNIPRSPMVSRETWSAETTLDDYDTVFSTQKVVGQSFMLKEGGSLSTAPYKMGSLIGLLPLESPSLIGSVADGTGGYLKVLGMAYPHAKLFYNSLVVLDGLEHHALDQSSPPALDDCPHLRSRLVHLERTYQGLSDIAHQSYEQFLRPIGPFDLLTCDMEGSTQFETSKYLAVTRNLINGGSPNRLLIKLYINNKNCVIACASLMRGSYKKVRLIRSLFSTTGNAEVFLLGEELVGPCEYKVSHKGFSIKGQVQDSVLSTKVGEFLVKVRDDRTILPLGKVYQMEAWLKTPMSYGPVRSLLNSSLIDLVEETALTFPNALWEYLDRQPFVKGTRKSRKRLGRNLISRSTKQGLSLTYLLLGALACLQKYDLVPTLEEIVPQLYIGFDTTDEDNRKLRVISESERKTYKGDILEKLENFVSGHLYKLLYRTLGYLLPRTDISAKEGDLGLFRTHSIKKDLIWKEDD